MRREDPFEPRRVSTSSSRVASRFCLRSVPDTYFPFLSVISSVCDQRDHGFHTSDERSLRRLNAGLPAWHAARKNGKRLGFGLWIVRGSLKQVSREWGQNINTLLDRIEKDKGKYSVYMAWKQYRTIQGVSDGCICKDAYHGTNKHKVYQVSSHTILAEILAEAHIHLGAEYPAQFNELVCNSYDKSNDESIPWHSDRNNLLDYKTEIVTINCKGAGVFVHMPRSFSDFANSIAKNGNRGVLIALRLGSVAASSCSKEIRL